MHNPLRGIVTSEHEDDGGYKHHRGRDIGTRDLGTSLLPVWVYGVGRPVYAAFSGRWKKIVRWSKPGNKTSTWAPTRTGNGGLVANPDGEGNGYNHVLILAKWSEGDWINEGELIGHLDLSGNMSAPHLHFEMWSRWQDPYSDYSPKIVFDKYGISTMDDPARVVIKPAATTPTGGLTVSEAAAINKRLDELSAQVSLANKNNLKWIEGQNKALAEIKGTLEKAYVRDTSGRDLVTRQTLLDAEVHQWSREAVELLTALATRLGKDEPLLIESITPKAQLEREAGK